MATLLRLWVVLTICDVAEKTMAQQCPSERSISGWMLQRHIYKTALADIGLPCLSSCGTDVRCQSFNFVMSSHVCEFNDRTKEAKPKDFIPDPDRHYFKKPVNRVPLGSIPELAAESCKEIKMSEEETTSGMYWLSSINPGIPSIAFCNMTTEDINECTSSPPACNINAQCSNTIGSYRCTCNPGYTGNGKTCTAVTSCNEILQNQGRAKSQVYTLMLGSRNIPVYCHMGDFGCGGGGWTLVMKTDGTKNTFHYSSPFWSNRQAYNLAGGKTGFDKQETKLPSYWETHFSKVCLGMRTGSKTRFVVIRQSANSLYALIADGAYRAVSLGRNKWKSLIGPQASLQTNCNKEGFNVVVANISSKARVGIIANNENDCLTCDSRIGYGSGGLHDDSNTCGNEATILSDNGDKHIKAMGYILVQ